MGASHRAGNLSPDPPGEAHRPGELHDGDIRVEGVGVPGRVLDGPGDADVLGSPPVTAGGDVVVPQPHVVGPGAPRDGIKAVGGSEDGVLVEEGPPALHLEPRAEPLPAHYDSPGPGTRLSLISPDNFLPVTHSAVPAWCRARGGGWSRGRGRSARHQRLVGVSAAHREVETLKPARTADCLGRERYCLLLFSGFRSHLEEVGEDLGVDSLLEDDLEDGRTLAGENVLTGAGLTQGCRAAVSSSPLVTVHTSGQARDVRGAFTEDVHQGIDRASPSIVPVIAAKFYTRLTGETGTRGSTGKAGTCGSATIIRTRWYSSTIWTRWSSTIIRS